MRAHDGGFSLLEAIIATALTTAVVAAVFAMAHPALGWFATESETFDMQQRLRVAVDTLTRDLAMAGAGAYAGGHTGSLMHYFPPIQPSGQGITMRSVPATAAQTQLTADLMPGVQTLQVAAEPGCPAGTNLCGFAPGLTVAVYDGTGNVATFTIATVSDAALQLTLAARPAGSAATIFTAGSTVAEVRVHTYYLNSDVASQTFQLMHQDDAGLDVPVVDHVVALRFDYYGDPRAPVLNADGEASYGPATCLFPIDPPSGLQVSRLPALSASTTLTLMTSDQFADGPWCPDEGNANRWDADLLRVRTVGVTLRVEAALAELRGPAGVLFANGGSSRAANRWAPDQEVRFQVSPRNLNLGR